MCCITHPGQIYLHCVLNLAHGPGFDSYDLTQNTFLQIKTTMAAPRAFEGALSAEPGGSGWKCNHSLTCPSPQGAGGAAVSQTRLQRVPEQQASSSSNPGPELLLLAPSGAVGPAQEPALQDAAASGSQPQPGQRCRIHRGGHSRDTPVSFFWLHGVPASPPFFLLR